MVFNERVSSRTSSLGFLLTAIIGIMALPGWAWSQNRDEGAEVLDDSSVTTAPDSDSEGPSRSVPAQPGTASGAPAQPAATAAQGAAPPAETTGRPGQRFAPAPDADRETSKRPADQPDTGRRAIRAANRRMTPPAASGQPQPGRAEPAATPADGGDVIQEIPVPDSHRKILIRTTPSGTVIVEFDEGDGRVRLIGTISASGGTTPFYFGSMMGNPSRRVTKSPANQFPARTQNDSQPGTQPKQAQAELLPDAPRQENNLSAADLPVRRPGPGTDNQNHASADEWGAQNSTKRPSPVASRPQAQPEVVELAQINVEEKLLELEAARDDLAANPGDAKLQRKQKLAALALRRAEIELNLAKSGRQPDGVRSSAPSRAPLE